MPPYVWDTGTYQNLAEHQGRKVPVTADASRDPVNAEPASVRSGRTLDELPEIP